MSGVSLSAAPAPRVHLVSFGCQMNVLDAELVLGDLARRGYGRTDDPADADGVPASLRTFFDREVRPHVPDAWIDTGKRDSRDGRVGVIGYEINFNRYFYRYTPPRPLEEIEADIRAIERDIVRMLAEVTGAKPGAQ